MPRLSSFLILFGIVGVPAGVISLGVVFPVFGAVLCGIAIVATVLLLILLLAVLVDDVREYH